MRRVADTGPGALTSSRRPVEHLAAVAELPRKCPHRLLPSPTIGAEQSAGWHAATQGRGSAKGTGPVFTRSHGRASPRSVEHCGLARGAAPPFEPPASRAAGPHDRTRRRRARSEAAPPPAPLSARCGRTMPPGWGTWCRSQAASIPSCRVEAGAVRQPVDFRRERGPVGGRGGGVPRQPLPGTREAWPQGVGWLSHRNWPPAVASITPGIPGREGGASSRMSVVGRGPPVVYTAEIPYSETRTLRSA